MASWEAGARARENGLTGSSGSQSSAGEEGFSEPQMKSSKARKADPPPADLQQIFGPGGWLSRQLPQYEQRPSQLEMAEAVLYAIERKQNLCAEAGTGTGKTLAYLIPALLSGRKVMVSTATRNLQDQLLSKDIPFLRRHLFPKLSVTCMKGRQNYLCLRRLHEGRDAWLPLAEGKDPSAEIRSWAARTETGDRAELDWLGGQDGLWTALDARSEICTGQNCGYFDRCFVTEMRRRAFKADLVVVNHALFFANLALERDEIGRVLPEFSVMIFDEAHELEDIAAGHFGNQLSSYQFEELERDLLQAFVDAPGLGRAITRLRRCAGALFDALPAGDGKHSLNLYPSPDGGLMDLRDAMQSVYRDLRDALTWVRSEVELPRERPDEWEPLVRRIDRIRSSLDEVFLLNEADQVYWFERRRAGVFLNVNPISIRKQMRERLFSRADSTILTSATLTTGGNFSFIRERLGLPRAIELKVSGEFDFASQAILYVPSRFPNPGSPGRLSASIGIIQEILDITSGHAFVLFTSFEQLKRVYQALSFADRFPVFRQGQMPRHRLLETFRETPGAVLCATSSFWQGVDVKGDALRAVIIDKLPFQVPSEPMVAARLHRLQQEGANAFYQYSVPNAVITLKQGLGRLIRSRLDRGILAVLDDRLRRRDYGRLFMESLPNCPLTDNILDLRNFYLGGASSPSGGLDQ